MCVRVCMRACMRVCVCVSESTLVLSYHSSQILQSVANTLGEENSSKLKHFVKKRPVSNACKNIIYFFTESEKCLA